MDLVTGGSGFLGQHLVKRLLKEGRDVRVLDIAEMDNKDLRSSVEFIKADVSEYSRTLEAFKGVETVFHAAALVPITKANIVAMRKVNVHGTRNVLKASLDFGVDKFIFISSSAIYGLPKKCPITGNTLPNPIEVYGFSKLEAEQICQAFRAEGLNVIILRPRTIIGEWRLGILGFILERICQGKKFFMIGTGGNKFQLLHIDDFSEACVLASRQDIENEDFNLGTDKYKTLREDMGFLARRTGSTTIFLPPRPTKILLSVLDKTGCSPFTKWHYETIDHDFWFDITKAKKMLKWQPKFSNVRMLYATYKWYVEHLEEIGMNISTPHRSPLRKRIFHLLDFI